MWKNLEKQKKESRKEELARSAKEAKKGKREKRKVSSQDKIIPFSKWFKQGSEYDKGETRGIQDKTSL